MKRATAPLKFRSSAVLPVPMADGFDGGGAHTLKS